MLCQPYEFHAAAFEALLRERLTVLLQGVLPLQDSPLQVRVTPPEAQEAARYRCANLTLRGQIQLGWEGADQALCLDFPYPCNGVFVIHADDEAESGLWTWRPHLVHKPGFWRLVRYTGGGRTEQDRLVFADGSFLDLPLKSSRKAARARRNVLRLLPGLLGEGKRPGDCWLVQEGNDPSPLVKWIREHQPDLLPEKDEQDLAALRLATYPATLFLRLVRALIPHLPAQPGDAGQAEDFWKRLCKQAPDIRRAWLPPIGMWLRGGRLLPFRPLNPLEALSQLTGIEKYGYRSAVIERLPAAWRQNHPSYRGWICPVESPESKRVGISLHLARGVRTDVLGALHQVDDRSGADELGYAAALVPFYQHNDGPRAMMGAKNLKQAVPLDGTEEAGVTTGCEDDVLDRVRPLRDLGFLAPSSEAAPGRDLLVAYLPYFGWNYEDAIVANARLAGEGVLDWVFERNHGVYVRPGHRPVAYAPPTALGRLGALFCYDEQNLRRPGPIGAKDAIAYLGNGTDVAAVPSGSEGDGELVSARFHAPPLPGMGGRLEWCIRYRRPLVVGDKLMGRYGNKGVISLLLPPEQMPRLPDDPRLPESLRGRAVDLVLNPHGVISRMNLGQLLETQFGLARALGIDGPWAKAGNARAFSTVPLEALRRAFRDCDLARGTTPLIDEYGRMRLIIPSPDDHGQNRETEAPVTVGFQRFCRLRHHPPLKAQVRRGRTAADRYSLLTGQPVAGRRLGGGQRLGEMEMWALAAHQARSNLAAALGHRSDPSQPAPEYTQSGPVPHGGQDQARFGGEAVTAAAAHAPAQADDAAAAPQTPCQTWRAIVDHLRALGIRTVRDATGWRLEWLTDAMLQRQGREIQTAALRQLVRTGTYRCPQCGYAIGMPVEATGYRRRDRDTPVPTVADLLRALGYALDGSEQGDAPLSQGSYELEKTLHPLDAATGSARELKLTLAVTGRQAKLEFGWGGQTYSAYRQIDRAFHGTGREIAAMELTCPRHRSRRLAGEAKVAYQPTEGGLCDPARVGDCALDSPATLPLAYIGLQRPAVFNGRERLLIPVLPLRYRQAARGGRGGPMVEDPLTQAYADLASGRLTGPALSKTLAGISDTLARRLTGKFGLWRRHGLGRRVDASGRFVIVPDPVMEWDECGVPTEALIVLLGQRLAQWPDLASRLNELGLDELIRLAFEGVTYTDAEYAEIKRELAGPQFWNLGTLRALQARRKHLELARQVIASYLEAHPQIRVILNRQPSLHRYSVAAFRPLPLPPEDGLVLRIHPLVCKGFGADFDGDEMSLHCPGTAAEMDEAAILAPTRHLLSVADGNPVPGFDQDFVLGHYLLAQDAAARRRLAGLLSGCATCASLLEEKAPWTRPHGERLLRHLCADHAEDCARLIPAWMRLCFERATYAGVSFGALELAELASGVMQGWGAAAWRHTDVNRALEQRGLNYLQAHALPDAGASRSPPRPAQGLAEIALSGARGAKQVRQLIAARGHLDPGDIGFAAEPEDASFLIRRNLIAGMTPEEAFWAAMNARSSMVDKKLVTPRAGFLTRKLVLALWGWRILKEDCGASGPRSVLTCQWQEREGICQTCYGEVPGIGRPPPDWPIGLIAAQSFGERGTQLSMQSFHTGERALTIDEVDALLEGRLPKDTRMYADARGFGQFTAALRNNEAYARLDERHLQLIWLIIHRSRERGLTAAWKDRRAALSGLAGGGQMQWLHEVCDKGKPEAETSPFLRLMLGLPPL